jgi:hypothetical protein
MFWPQAFAKTVAQPGSGNESTLFFTLPEFLKGLEVIIYQSLKAQGDSRPAKDDVQSELQLLHSSILRRFNRYKLRGMLEKRRPKKHESPQDKLSAQRRASGTDILTGEHTSRSLAAEHSKSLNTG